MMTSEGVPLWNTVAHPFASALEFAFGCHHARLSRHLPLTATLTRCAAIVGPASNIPPDHVNCAAHKHFPSLRRLRARNRRRKSLRRAELA